MELLLWLGLGAAVLIALVVVIIKVIARDKRGETALSPEELKRKRAIERLAADL